MEYYSAIKRNKSESVLMRWMNLKAVRFINLNADLNESSLSQKEKNKHCISIPMCVCVRACTLSRFSRVWLCATLWSVAHRAPLSVRFSRQEYQNGLPCLPPGMEPTFLMHPALAGSFFTTSATWFTTRLTTGFSKFPHNFAFYNDFALGTPSILGKPIELLLA